MRARSCDARLTMSSISAFALAGWRPARPAAVHGEARRRSLPGRRATAATVNCDAIAPIDPTAVIDDMETPGLHDRPCGRAATARGGRAAIRVARRHHHAERRRAAEAIPGGRCGSMYAMHVTGQGFTVWSVLSVSMGWGSVDGGADGLLPNDDDCRHRHHVLGAHRRHVVQQGAPRVSDKYSRPEGGFCVDGHHDTSDYACFDTHGVDLTQLTTTWTQYRIPFGGLTQRNFGLPRQRLDPAASTRSSSSFATVTPFDFWVDDVAFY